MRKVLLLATLVLSLCMSVQAQELRTVDGRKYIAHTVQPGQTLFGISQHYAVPILAIAGANPGAADGLSVGQVLLIPLDAQVKKELKSAPAMGNGELLHTVEKKETLYGIGRRYGVSQELLLAKNPDLAQGLKPGMVLHIPVAGSTAAPAAATRPSVMDSSRAHEVLPGETVYGLAKQFGLTVDQLKAANGGLPEGLKVGQYIKVPAAAQIAAPRAIAPAMAAALGHVWKIALMLPFSAGSGDSTSVAEGQQPSATQAAIEFNAGMAMALDTVRKEGLSADVHVFDTGDSPSTWEPLMRSDSVRGMDIYIGPFHRAAIESLTRVAGGAPIVCPVPQSNKVLLGHPSVSKVVSGRPDQVQQLARYVASHNGRDNIVLCMANIYGERELQRQVQRQLADALVGQTGLLHDSVPVVMCERRDVSAAIALLDATRPNAVVVPSEDVEFVTTVLNKFGPLIAKYDITVYGMNAWLDIGTLDVSALSKLHTHVPASIFIDYSYPPVEGFVQRYRDRFKNEPSEYAFLGYDTGLYYLTALLRFGTTFPDHFAEVGVAPLHMAFRLVKMGPENGYRNESAMMLEYRDMGIRPAQ